MYTLQRNIHRAGRYKMIQYLDWIIKIGAVLGALGVIIGVAIKIWNKINDIVDSVTGFQEDIKDLKEHTEENYMALLQLKIMSNEMPIGERIIAGRKYLDRGGNGDIKKFLIDTFNITNTIEDAPHYKE
jgi:hypothetical protein